MTPQVPETSASEIAESVASALAGIPTPSDTEVREPGAQATVRSLFEAGVGARWTELERRLRLLIDRPPWYFVLRGLPADESGRIVVALSAVLGEALEPLGEPWSRVVRRVEATAPGGLDEHPHTDSTDWPDPNAWTMLQCIRPDRGGGGRSCVIETASVVSQIVKHRGPQALELVRDTPMPWALADALGGGIHYEAALGARIRWMPHTVQFACERDDATLDHSAAAALEIVAEAVRAADTREVLLRAGDVLIVDNQRALHGRTPVQGLGRLLLRTKVGPARK